MCPVGILLNHQQHERNKMIKVIKANKEMIFLAAFAVANITALTVAPIVGNVAVIAIGLSIGLFIFD
jgi:hypothetical protein